MKNMLYRSPITGFLGFDEVFDRLDKDLSKAFNKVTYPPYNIIKILDSKNQSADHLDYEDAKIIGYTIEVALAGFQKDEIKVSRDGRELTITAHKNDKDAHIYQYVHKGISERSANLTFQLSEELVVKDVKFENGMLRIFFSKQKKGSTGEVYNID